MASRVLSTALRPAASLAVTRQAVPTPRSFGGSTMALKHKESTGEGYDPEKHKQDLLAKHKAGKGHWKPELASDSEEAVKADRSAAAAAPGEDMTALQNRTKATAEETSKTGTSMRDGL
ncbi:putative mitochondrial carrier protein pet8 protein [Rosellinia necatrix]|uniref:Putative mitochondrial carrier protein pet8 protein n=1 Tax=Rosellinia necatrix TaxID=77044 RepID=A0A1S8A521_ROSNE|nr:putative mitochondrial carrier protein pet8 protein [Rosellinia necatrix]